MEFTYKHRKGIARITLAAIFVVLLLALNFVIWDSNYLMGSFEDSISRNAADIEQCNVFSEITSLDINQNLSMENASFNHIDFIESHGNLYWNLAAITFLLFLTTGYLISHTKDTLVALCIRMNN